MNRLIFGRRLNGLIIAKLYSRMGNGVQDAYNCGAL